MSLKVEIETWVAALDAYKSQDFQKSIQLFASIEPNSKMMCNMGLIYAAMGDHEAAVEHFQAATSMDPYLAIAYFQSGVSNFMIDRYDLAFEDFDGALGHLRGNQAINYEQIGLKFILFSAEVLFNKGLALMRMGRFQEGMELLYAAQLEKSTPEHDVIDDAIAESGEGYTVFSISIGLLYEPSPVKVKNSKARDWLGKAKLIQATDVGDMYTSFSGPARLQRSASESAPVPRAVEDIPVRSRSATVVTTKEKEITPLKPLVRAGTIGPRVTFSNEKTAPASRNTNSPGPTVPILNRSPSSVNVKPTGANIPISNPVSASRSTSRSPSNASSLVSLEGDQDDLLVSIAETGNDYQIAEQRQEIYGGLLESYSPVKPSPPPLAPLPPVPLTRAPTTKQTMPSAFSAYTTSEASYPAPRRMPSRRMMEAGSVQSRAMSRYENGSVDWTENEPGYQRSSFAELTKLRLKLYYQDEVRGMAISPEMPFIEFMERICAKFGHSFGSLRLKFEDEDGGKVSLRDESDYEMAIETAKENAGGRSEGKLLIWCEGDDY